MDDSEIQFDSIDGDLRQVVFIDAEENVVLVFKSRRQVLNDTRRQGGEGLSTCLSQLTVNSWNE